MLSYRVLIVDDQLLQREYLKSLFIQAGIAQVDTAENGCHALSLLEQQRYDLVLSDLLMPELDGVQLIQRLSTYEAPPLLAVISSSPKRLISGASLVAKHWACGSSISCPSPPSRKPSSRWWPS